MTLFNRLPLHDQVNDIVGDFSSSICSSWPPSARPSGDRAHATQRQLWEDMSHRLVSGVQAWIRTARQWGAHAHRVHWSGQPGTAGRDASGFSGMGTLVTSITQTPQVWLFDHQTAELWPPVLNWGTPSRLFPEGLVEDMFDAYVCLLNRLAADDAAWLEAAPLTLFRNAAPGQAAYNATGKGLFPGKLWAFFQAGPRTPEALAVATPPRGCCMAKFSVGQDSMHVFCRTRESAGELGRRGDGKAKEVVAVAGAVLAGATSL